MIRPLATRDRDDIHRLLLKTNTFNEMEIQVALEVLGECISRGDESGYSVLCYEDEEGCLRGYLCFGPIPLTDFSYDIYWIAVDPGMERRGVGKALLAETEALVAARGGSRIYLDTSSTGAYGKARAFYEKFGYRELSTLPDFYRPGDHKIIYMKAITA